MKTDLARLHEHKLCDWLAEFRIRTRLGQALEEEHPLSEDVRNEMAGQRKGAGDDEIRIGEVRILDPFATAATRTPLLVAILEDRGDDFFMVCPFAPYTTPATCAELTVSDDPMCAVLELWNIARVPGSALRPSYTTGSLPEDLCIDIKDFFAAGTPLFHKVSRQLPWHLIQRIGPPLIKLEDPRWVHIREEKLLIKALGGTYQARQQSPIPATDEKARPASRKGKPASVLVEFTPRGSTHQVRAWVAPGKSRSGSIRVHAPRLVLSEGSIRLVRSSRSCDIDGQPKALESQPRYAPRWTESENPVGGYDLALAAYGAETPDYLEKFDLLLKADKSLTRRWFDLQCERIDRAALQAVLGRLIRDYFENPPYPWTSISDPKKQMAAADEVLHGILSNVVVE